MQVSVVVWDGEGASSACMCGYKAPVILSTLLQLHAHYATSFRWRILTPSIVYPGRYRPCDWRAFVPFPDDASLDLALKEVSGILDTDTNNAADIEDEDAPLEVELCDILDPAASLEATVVLHAVEVAAVASALPPSLHNGHLHFVGTHNCCVCNCDDTVMPSLFDAHAAVAGATVVDALPILLQAARRHAAFTFALRTICCVGVNDVSSTSSSTGQKRAELGSELSTPRSSRSRGSAGKERAQQGAVPALDVMKVGANGQRALELLRGKNSNKVSIHSNVRKSRAKQFSTTLAGSQTPLDKKKVGFESPTASAVRVVSRLSRNAELVVCDFTSRLNKFLVDGTPHKVYDARGREDEYAEVDGTIEAGGGVRSLSFASERSTEVPTDDSIKETARTMSDFGSRLLLLPNGQLGPQAAAQLCCSTKGRFQTGTDDTLSLQMDAAFQASLSVDPLLAAWWSRFSTRESETAAGGGVREEMGLSTWLVAGSEKNASGMSDIDAMKRIYDTFRLIRKAATVQSGLCSPQRMARTMVYILHDLDFPTSSDHPFESKLIPPHICGKLQAFAAKYALPARMQAVLNRLVFAFFALINPPAAIKRSCTQAQQEFLFSEQPYAPDQPLAPWWMLQQCLDIRRFMTHEFPAAVAMLSSFDYQLRAVVEQPLLKTSSSGTPARPFATPSRSSAQQKKTPPSRHMRSPYGTPSRHAMQAFSGALRAQSSTRSPSKNPVAMTTLNSLEAEGQALWRQLPVCWEAAGSLPPHVAQPAAPVLGGSIALALVRHCLQDVLMSDYISDEDFLPMMEKQGMHPGPLPTDGSTAPPGSTTSLATVTKPEFTRATLPTYIRARHRTLQVQCAFLSTALSSGLKAVDASLPQHIQLSRTDLQRLHRIAADMCFLVGGPGGIAQSSLYFLAETKGSSGLFAKWLAGVLDVWQIAFPSDVAKLYLQRGIIPSAELQTQCEVLGIDVTADETLAPASFSGFKRRRRSQRKSMKDNEKVPVATKSDGSIDDGTQAKVQSIVQDDGDVPIASPPRKPRRSEEPETISADPTAVETSPEAAAPTGTMSLDSETADHSIVAPEKVRWGLARRPPAFAARDDVISFLKVSESTAMAVPERCLSPPKQIAQVPLVAREETRALHNSGHTRQAAAPSKDVQSEQCVVDSLLSNRRIQRHIGQGSLLFLRRSMTSLPAVTKKPRTTKREIEKGR